MAQQAGKRIAASSVNWAKLSDRLTTEHAAELTRLKGQYTTFAAKINELPADPPKFDFADLKKKMPMHAATIDALQKQYEAVSIPYGSVPDKFTQEIGEWIKYQDERIKLQEAKTKEGDLKAKKVEEKWARGPPVRQMQRETFLQFFPTKFYDYRFETMMPTFFGTCDYNKVPYIYSYYSNYRFMGRPGSDHSWDH